MNRQTRIREFPGPTPYSVAIFAKPRTRRPIKNLLMKQRRLEELRLYALELTKLHELAEKQNDWENKCIVSAENSSIERAVKNILEQSELGLDEKKQRLYQVLGEEDAQLLAEFDSTRRKTESTLNELIERGKRAKANREKERLQIVKDKLDQQWRNECEESRSIISRCYQDQISIDQMKQLSLKAFSESRKQEEERVFADLWEKDRLAKEARENLEAQKKYDGTRAMQQALQIQSGSLEARKMKDGQLYTEEGNLVTEERDLRHLEKLRAAELKKMDQEKIRSSLDTCMRLKQKRESQQRQEEFKYDMKLKERPAFDFEGESQVTSDKKLQLNKEENEYREYLKRQLEEATRKEKEFNQLVDAEAAKVWTKMLQKNKMDKTSRHRKVQDLVEGRQRQRETKMRFLAQHHEDLSREKEEAKMRAMLGKKLDEEEIEKTKLANKLYASDLLAQIEHNQRERDTEKLQEFQEYEQGLKEEAEYQERLRKVVMEHSFPKQHPMHLQGKSV